MADVGIKFGVEGNAEFKKAIADINRNLKVLGSEMKAVSSEYDKNDRSVEALTAKNKVLNKEIDEQKNKVKTLESALKNSVDTYGENSKETQQWTVKLNEAKAKLNNLEREVKQNEDAMNGLGDEVKQTGNDMDDAGRKATSFGDILKATLASGIILEGIRAIGRGIKELASTALQYNSDMENYTTNFKVMLGSDAAAAKKVEELKKFAASTPFTMGDLADATQTLLAFNISSDKSTDVLKKLGDISLGDSEKLNSLTRAYGQMSSANKVSLEKIQIMIEAGYNPLLNIQKRTGESMDDLYKRISAGKVPFSELEQAITDATSKGGQFCGGMEQASKTMSGLMSTLSDNAKALVGEVFEPISDGLVSDILPKAIEAVQELTDAYETKGIDGMIKAAGGMLGNFIAEAITYIPDIIEMVGQLVISFSEAFLAPDNLYKISMAATDTILTLVDGLLGAAGSGDVLDKLSQIGAAIIRGIWAAIKKHWNEFWNNDTSFDGKSLGQLSNGFGRSSGGGKAGGGFGSPNSNAVGLDYVPYDNYLSYLHKGEMIVPADVADGLRGAINLPTQSGVKIGMSGYQGAATVNHTGTIRVEGVNSSGEMQSVVDIVMDNLRRECRV